MQNSYIWLQSLSTVMQRSTEFIWWLYPVMWLFWPAELSCRSNATAATKAKKKGYPMGNEGTAERSSSGSSEGDTYATPSTASYINLH